MKIELKQFQAEHAANLISDMLASQEDVIRRNRTSAVILAAPTGSGKTVIATKAIETLMLTGDEAVNADPGATFLWLSDQPELNEQTLRKMVDTSSVGSQRLHVIDAAFDQEALSPGRVYFLNTQKLGEARTLITRGDKRAYTIWQTINNTIRDSNVRLYLFIDEAHRGMSDGDDGEEAATIVQKFIRGSDELTPIPVVVGISATPARFQRYLTGTARVQRPNEITPDEVRASGLLKSDVAVFHPQETQPSEMTLLRQAVKDWEIFTQEWAVYCAEAGEPEIVKPIMVVQVEDASATSVSRTSLSGVIAAIREEAGDEADEAFAHAFQEGAPLRIGETTVRYLRPPDIVSDPAVKFVLFKSSLNTGWDCPRAEVMMSFRRATDYTSIAQLVGRLVRAPLTRHITGSETLNSVSLYLPHYNAEALKRVVRHLTEEGESVSGVDFTTNPVVLKRAPGSEAIFAILDGLPSMTVPRSRKVNDVRRLMKLARRLSRDHLAPDADVVARDQLVDVLVAENERLAGDDEYRNTVEGHGTIQVTRADWEVGAALRMGDEPISLDVSREDLDSLFVIAKRKVTEEIAHSYLRHRHEAGESISTAKRELVALVTRPGVEGRVRSAARDRIRSLFFEHDPRIRTLGEAARAAYEDIRRRSPEPEQITLTFQQEIRVSPHEAKRDGHIYVDEDGKAPLRLNDWEERALRTERERGDHLGWLRNIDRRDWAVCASYRVGEEFKPMYPDFLFFRSGHDGRVIIDIIDPHDPGLEDAISKAQGLAKYAADFGERFGRIELVAEIDGELKYIDLQDETVRERLNEGRDSAYLRAMYR